MQDNATFFYSTTSASLGLSYESLSSLFSHHYKNCYFSVLKFSFVFVSKSSSVIYGLPLHLSPPHFGNHPSVARIPCCFAFHGHRFTHTGKDKARHREVAIHLLNPFNRHIWNPKWRRTVSPAKAWWRGNYKVMVVVSHQGRLPRGSLLWACISIYHLSLYSSTE